VVGPLPPVYHFTTTSFPAISCPIWRLIGDLGCLINDLRWHTAVATPQGVPHLTPLYILPLRHSQYKAEFTFTITEVYVIAGLSKVIHNEHKLTVLLSRKLTHVVMHHSVDVLIEA
jgi:hypothetical protein